MTDTPSSFGTGREPSPPAADHRAETSAATESADPLAWIDATPFYQAGLQGYSDAAMRIVARRLGAPYCVTESMLDRFLVQGGRGLDAARLDPEDHPIAGQLMGSHPEDIAEGARVLLELGYDVVDVNVACPVRKVRKHCRGGHLLERPDEAIEILRAASDAVSGRVPVTVKLRRGTDDTLEAESRFRRILEAVIDLGFASATIHGRTVVQKYDGPSSWPHLARLVREYEGFRILGSGDIFEARDIFRMIESTGVKAVSVARGAIGNPWIFREARELADGREPRAPTVAEQREALAMHVELSARLLDDGTAGRRLRKLGIKMSPLHPRADEVKRAFIAVRTLDEFHEVLARHYDAG